MMNNDCLQCSVSHVLKQTYWGVVAKEELDLAMERSDQVKDGD